MNLPLAENFENTPLSTAIAGVTYLDERRDGRYDDDEKSLVGWPEFLAAETARFARVVQWIRRISGRRRYQYRRFVVHRMIIVLNIRVHDVIRK